MNWYLNKSSVSESDFFSRASIGLLVLLFLRLSALNLIHMCSYCAYCQLLVLFNEWVALFITLAICSHESEILIFSPNF